MTYTSHLQLWFELGFGFLKAILSLIVGSHNVSHRATENEFGVAVQQQSCYVTSLRVFINADMFLITSQ